MNNGDGVECGSLDLDLVDISIRRSSSKMELAKDMVIEDEI